jgi:NAD(P)-dependent dehydrogenase (short-subunit alcohol dehydrogenase family)
MDLGIRDKVAIVTGGSSGIGRECAIDLASEGVKVAFVGRDQPRLQQTLAMTREAGTEGFAITADLSNEEGCASAVEACISHYGTVDILVNVAGAAQPSSVLKMPRAAVQDGLDLKFFGYMHMAQLVAPYMQEKGWGRIVNVAGAAGTSPTTENLPTSLANITVMNLTHALSDALSPYGILVNVVCPGGVDTPRTHARYAARAEREGKPIEAVIADLGKDLPAGRIARADEVAKVVTFLCSEPCSYVFASAIYMDGGGRRATP